MFTDAVEHALDFWEWVEYSAAAIVFGGAIGEFISEFTRWPENKYKREQVGKVSALILIVGLAAELIGLVRTSQISGQITAQLNKQAGNARRDAANANRDAARARRDAEAFKRDAESFKRDIANANARAAEASETAERERLARLQLEAKLAPRKLSVEQQRRISDRLRPFLGKPYDLFVEAEPEATRLLEVIDKILTSAKWLRVPPKSTLLYQNKAGLVSSSGVKIQITKNKMADFGPALEVFVKALRDEGIGSLGVAVPEGTTELDNSNAIHVIIGKKP